MRDKNVFELTLFSMFLAILVVLSLPPFYLGYVLAIPFLGVQLTIIHIPVIVFALILGRKYSWALGLAFGISSLVVAFIVGVPMFQNPLISVFPRILFGFLTYEIYVGLRNVIKQKHLMYGIVIALSTLAHTLLVTAMIFLFGRGVYLTNQEFVNQVLIPIVSLNGFVEIIVGIVIGVPVLSRIIAFYEARDFQ